jgi:hypothetical protein
MRDRRCRPDIQDVLEVLGLLLVDVAEHLLGEDLREPDDGVQRSAELVRHVREELRFVPAGRFELGALVRDLPEEPGVLDGQGRLGGESLEDLDGLAREFARCVPVE